MVKTADSFSGVPCCRIRNRIQMERTFLLPAQSVSYIEGAERSSLSDILWTFFSNGWPATLKTTLFSGPNWTEKKEKCLKVDFWVLCHWVILSNIINTASQTSISKGIIARKWKEDIFRCRKNFGNNFPPTFRRKGIPNFSLCLWRFLLNIFNAGLYSSFCLSLLNH